MKEKNILESLTWRRLTNASLVYIIATCILSYPLVVNLTSASRLDNGDARLNAWAISWVAHQLVENPIELFEANIFYPLRHSLAYSEHLTLQGLLALPLLAITDDLVLTNNLILLFSMFASALGMYFLAWTLTKNHLASILTGLFFSFAPFRFNRLPHIQMQLYAFLPVALAGIHLFITNKNRRWLLVFSGAFVLQTLAGTYLGAISAVAILAALITLLPNTLAWRKCALLGASFMTSLSILAPFAMPYLWVNRELGVEWELNGLSVLSATPIDYLASSSRLYHGISTEWFNSPKPTDFLFPGLTLLVLGFLGMWLTFRNNSKLRIGLCYGAILVTGVVLSMGPNTPIYPFLYENIVFFRGLRALTRFAILPLLSLSIFSAFALSWLFDKFDRPCRPLLLALPISLFFIVESTGIPYALKPHVDDPPKVYTWLNDQAPGPFVELPFKVVDTRYMFWGRHHGFRPTLNGDSGFIPMSHQWIKIALSRFPSPDSVTILQQLQVRYVILHLKAFRPRALSRILKGLEEYASTIRPIRNFGDQLVYEVVQTPNLKSKKKSTKVTSKTLVLSQKIIKKENPLSEKYLTIDIDLPVARKIEIFQLHYGANPRTPVSKIEILVENDQNELQIIWETPDYWPGIASLVTGLLNTPLDGTQTIEIDPLYTKRFKLRLKGIDGLLPDPTLLGIFGTQEKTSFLEKTPGNDKRSQSQPYGKDS